MPVGFRKRVPVAALTSSLGASSTPILSLSALLNPVQLQIHPLMTIFSRYEYCCKDAQYDVMAAARSPSRFLKGKAVSPTCRSYIFKSFKTEEGYQCCRVDKEHGVTRKSVTVVSPLHSITSFSSVSLIVYILLYLYLFSSSDASRTILNFATQHSESPT